MASLFAEIRNVLAAPGGGGGPSCLVCGRGVAPKDERVRVRGGELVHRGCATYSMRRKRVGAARLGFKP